MTQLYKKNGAVFIHVGITVEEVERLKEKNAELQEKLKPENCLKLLAKKGYVKFTSDKINKAKELIEELSSSYGIVVEPSSIRGLAADCPIYTAFNPFPFIAIRHFVLVIRL